ncbi:MAG: hypothetical protein WC708_14735 [Lentisphaeria bacterium]
MTEENIKQATEVLVNDIARFTKDIESLRTTLPKMMRVAEDFRSESRSKYSEFLSTRGTVREKTGSITTYLLKMEDMSTASKLEREIEQSRIAFRLIPRNFLTSLVSQYDSFIGRLIRFMFTVKPEMLNGSDKLLSFAELTSFKDISSAREFIIEKEIETVIRKSHAEHFEWLKNKLKIPFNKDLACWPDFIELTERRNLFVHTDGKVSSQYIGVCSEYNYKTEKELHVGDQLEVSRNYFENAYKCIYEIGFKMSHVLWRKLCPELIKDSDENIIKITLELIKKCEYDLAIRLLGFFSQKQMKHYDDSKRRILLINYAQAFKWNNNNNHCLDVIKDDDWTACSDRFKLAVAVLHDDYDTCYFIMKRLKHDDDFNRLNYKEWPLFQELIKQPKFGDVYSECYGESFIVEQTATDQQATKTD